MMLRNGLLLPTVSDTDEWLCPVCVINGVLIIEAMKDKRIKRGKTEYLVSYTSSADEWQSSSHLSNCGPIIKRLVRDYNLAHRNDRVISRTSNGTSGMQ